MEKQETKKNYESVEQLSTVMKVVRPHNWIPIVIFIALALWAVGFLLFGEIPITAKGNAMFMTPETVIPFQATAGGQISRWHVKVGDYIRKGQLLTELEQPLIEKQLEQAKQKLEDIKAKNRSVESFTQIYIDLEKQVLVGKKRMLEDRIDVLRDQIAQSKELLDRIHSRKISHLAQQEKDMGVILDLNRRRSQELLEKLDLTEKLGEKKLRSKDQVLQSRQESIDQMNRVSDLNLQILQVGLQKAKASESFVESLNRIAEQENSVEDLEQQMGELINREAQLEEQLSSALFAMDMEATEYQRTIERAEKELTDNREIRSEYDGRILELTAGVGKLIIKGTRLGTVDTRKTSDILEAVVYFKLADGKKIKPGMTLRLTPATVQRERFGSLIATVRTVSSYPVSAEKVAKTVGNSLVAESLTKDGHNMEVFASLRRNETSFSGYQWDLSNGPEIRVTSGTIAEALANIQEKSPLTFVIPILRDRTEF